MFDIIIFTALAVFGIGLIYSIYSLLKNKNLKRKRRVWLVIILIICFIIESILIYGSFVEPQRITIAKEQVYLSENNDQTIRLALISDMHLGPYKKEKFVQKICKKLDEQKPDLVLLGGDFIAGPGIKEKKDHTKYLYALECISKKYPTYAVMGNHEYNIGRPYNFENFYDQTEKIQDIFKQINIQVLENESVLFTKEDNKFWLIGVDEVWALKNNLKKALTNTDNKYPKVLLSHNPDIFHDIKKDHEIDLTLCGHTHAGQIQLPFIGSLVEPPSDLGRNCYQHFCQIDNSKMFITNGIGETGPRARLFAPPEIAILELHF